MKPDARAAASKKRVDAAKGLSADHFSVWKHYEDRADQLGQELWSVGSWLAALVGATLSLPFLAHFVEPLPVRPYFSVTNRVGVGLAAAFGLLLCLYAFFALSDVREHIESNWRKAGYVLDGTWQSDWKGRKNHGWLILLAIGGLASMAFAGMLLLAVIGLRI
jgi:hypothetical protein